MPMVGTALAAALKPVIVTKVKANYTIAGAFSDAELEKFATALSDAIGLTVVSYIQSNAVVAGTVTTGAGSGGTVVGTVL